ncbi:hypothetical protein BJ912DRAFT_1045041 [Pholiota molesta]|nr:hypothetical protein BJ912DRAFT_1045041 [Pholiota molesta]
MEPQIITASSGSNLSEPSQRQYQRHQAEDVLDLKEKPIIIGNWLATSLWMIATLGLCRVFYKTWRLVPRSTRGVSEDLPFPVNTNNKSTQWKHILRKLKEEWKQIYLGCALILSISVALLQIDLSSERHWEDDSYHDVFTIGCWTLAQRNLRIGNSSIQGWKMSKSVGKSVGSI